MNGNEAEEPVGASETVISYRRARFRLRNARVDYKTAKEALANEISKLVMAGQVDSILGARSIAKNDKNRASYWREALGENYATAHMAGLELEAAEATHDVALVIAKQI